MNTYDYPLGADNSDAPWNEQTKLTPVDVTVSFTMSKNITVYTDNPDGDLKEDVESQIIFPWDSNWKDWDLDDFAVSR